MTVRMTLPQEAFRFDQGEIVRVSQYEDTKTLGGIIVDASTTCPVTGVDSTVGEEGLVIPRGGDDCLMLQVEQGIELRDIEHSLALAGTYVALHRQLRERQLVVSVTNQVMRRLAVHLAGFSVAKTLGSCDEAYYERLSEAYSQLSLSKRQDFQLSMVYMPTTDFIDTFAGKRLGSNPRRVLGEFGLDQ